MKLMPTSLGRIVFGAGLLGAVVGGVLVGGIEIATGTLPGAARRATDVERQQVGARDASVTSRLSALETSLPSTAASLDGAAPGTSTRTSDQDRGTPLAGRSDSRIDELNAMLQDMSRHIDVLGERLEAMAARQAVSAGNAQAADDLGRRLDRIESNGQKEQAEVSKLSDVIRGSHLASFTNLQDIIPRLDDMAVRVQRLEAR